MAPEKEKFAHYAKTKFHAVHSVCSDAQSYTSDLRVHLCLLSILKQFQKKACLLRKSGKATVQVKRSKDL